MLGRRRESACPPPRRLHAGVLAADWPDTGRWGALARRSEGRILASRSYQSGSTRVHGVGLRLYHPANSDRARFTYTANLTGMILWHPEIHLVEIKSCEPNDADDRNSHDDQRSSPNRDDARVFSDNRSLVTRSLPSCDSRSVKI